jgi:hypothetical protein
LEAGKCRIVDRGRSSDEARSGRSSGERPRGGKREYKKGKYEHEAYAIPFMKKNKAIGGWSIAGTAQFQTGTPCGIGTNNDFAGVGEYGSFGCGSQGQFWNLNGPVTINTGAYAGPSGNASSPKYFTANVSQPAAGTFNLQPGVRDSVYQPGLQDWNIALFKTFAVNDRAGFQFRAEAYDFINHPNLSGPNLNPTSSQFGEITSKTGLARNMQLSLRFYF